MVIWAEDLKLDIVISVALLLMKTCIRVLLDIDFEHVGNDFLPIMRTDIVVENKNQKLIIDAKYYSNALQVRNVGDTKKLISGNLYQIYTYINNSTFEGMKSGMLIYPVVDTDMDFVYSIQGGKIYVKTLNLNTSWDNIRN